MRKRKPNLSPKNPFRIIPGEAIKITVVIAIIAFGILFIAGGINRVLKTSDYFKIREVIVTKDSAFDLSYLKGENIFALDLPKESGYILEQNPTYRNIRLIKILPDRVFVDFVKRRALALVELYRIFSVDPDAVLFEAPQDLTDSDLPLVTGLETKIFGPKIGRKYNIKELVFALNTLKAFRFNRGLRFYKIKKIDVADLNNVSVFVELPFRDVSYKSKSIPERNVPVPYPNVGVKEALGWLEIKLGEEGFKDKVNVLAIMLMQAKNDLPNIRYIDLRFKDPLIKLKHK